MDSSAMMIPDYVTENARVQAGLSRENAVWAFGRGEAANWHPVTWLPNILDAQLFGLKHCGHRLTSKNLTRNMPNAE